MLRLLAEPVFRKALTDTGYEVGGSSPEEFARFYVESRKRWAGIVRQTGVTQE